MKYALFLGCVIPVKYPGFEKATREVLKTLGVELTDLPFSCCPAPTQLKLVHYDSWLALAARNLCLAEEAGLPILSICNGCVNTLKEANHILKNDPRRRDQVNRVLSESGQAFQGTIEVKHLLDVLIQDVGPATIAERVTRPLKGLRIGCHYGCHLYRPPRFMYPEDLSEAGSYVPTSMDHILTILGAQPTEYSRKFLCCGSALGSNLDQDAANEITREKLQHMKKQRIEAVAVACPSCFSQFDRGQMMLERKYHDGFRLPALHIAELLGLAFGLDPGLIPLGDHRINLEPVLKQISGDS
jgi:heterodisulfide reductase subunit B